MTSRSRLVNQVKTSFLYDSSTNFTVTLKLNDKQANFAFKLFESETLLYDFILWNSFKHLCFRFLNSWNHSMKIDWSIKWLHSFLVICLSVKFKNLENKLRDILDAYVDLDIIIFAKLFFVAASKLHKNFILDLFKLFCTDFKFIVYDSFFGILDCHFLFDFLQKLWLKIFKIIFGQMFWSYFL